MTASDLARRRFDAVVLPHLDAAYTLAKALTRNGADAEDIVQDACLRALKALEREEVEKPRAWLLTLTRNAALSFLARRGPPAADLEAVDRDGGAGTRVAPEAETRLLAADRSAALRAGLADLPLALRETLLMRVLHGLSYRDIAAATAAPMGTVMSRLARARATLADRLGPVSGDV